MVKDTDVPEAGPGDHWSSGALQRDPWDHHTSNVSDGGALAQEKVGL